MRSIAVFDFDGTLTTKDTFVEFVKFAHGNNVFYFGIVRFLPLLLLMKFGLFPNGKAKQMVFSYFFKGWTYERFAETARRFAVKIDSFKNVAVFNLLQEHRDKGDTIYIVSASIEEWVRPWCENNGITNVIGTQIEVNTDGLITGKFKTENCYGKEKVLRFLEKEPVRKEYYLYAYGDSQGDREIIAFSNQGIFV